jgi:hypothetical protein
MNKTHNKRYFILSKIFFKIIYEKNFFCLIFLFYSVFFLSSTHSEMTYIVKNKNGTTFYADLDNVKIKTGYRYFWGLQNYKEPKNGNLSIKAFFELDCDLMRFKFLTDYTYKKLMGKGISKSNNVPDKDWSYHPPDSAGGGVVAKIICNLSL